MRFRSVLGWLFCFAGLLSARQGKIIPVPQGTLGLAHRNCAACHRGHANTGSAPGLQEKGRSARVGGNRKADDACLQCHTSPALGAPAAGRALAIETLGAGASTHLGGRGGDAYRRTVRLGSKRFTLELTCNGCHDPHSRERSQLRTFAFDTRGQLLERRSQSAADLCFGCHAGPEAARTSSGSSDLGALFAKGGGSSHGMGVSATGRPDLPSLRSGLFQGRLDCTSCHTSGDPLGPKGPHSSPNPALLRSPFGHERDMGRLGDRTNELCFQCHDRSSIYGNQSFKFHAQHLQGFTPGTSPTPAKQANWGAPPPVTRTPRDFMAGRTSAFRPGFGEPTACATCHDSHGSLRNPSLVEFDRSVVTPGVAGAVSFQRLGLAQGNCTLSCHGYDHVQSRY